MLCTVVRSAGRLVCACILLLPILAAAESPTTRTAARKRASQPPQHEARAVWVTRFAYRKPEDVAQIMENCAKMRFNIVLFQVRGNGTVCYKSDLEPWAYELTGDSAASTGKDPGWDPLQTAIGEARKRGLQLHVWMNVFPGWRGQDYPPAHARQLWTEHPDWFMVDKRGQKMIPRDFRVDPTVGTWYSFLNPAHPGVKEYLPKVYAEVAQRYDIDGIHFDYVRYPGEIDDFSYDPVSLQRFKDEVGGTPDEKPQEWIEWRGRQVTDVVQRIYGAVTAVKPGLVVSGAVIPDYDKAKTRYYARSQEWLRDGILDAAIPMNYSHGTAFKAQAEDFVKHNAGRHVYVGMAGSPTREDRGTATPPAAVSDADRPTSPAVAGSRRAPRAAIVREIAMARSLGAQGVSIFSYSSLVSGDNINSQGTLLMEGPFRRPSKIPPMPWKTRPSAAADAAHTTATAVLEAPTTSTK